MRGKRAKAIRRKFGVKHVRLSQLKAEYKQVAPRRRPGFLAPGVLMHTISSRKNRGVLRQRNV